jgi:RND family efflux transporter MFP subunit
MVAVMTFSLRGAVRVGITLVVLLAAASAGHELWAHYMDEPWTRDAKVRADIVGVAPDVSGFVSEVLVRDNQSVKQGDVLFRIDRARFAIALEQAEAAVEGRKATLEQARRDRERYEQLKDVVSQQKTEQARMQEAEAAMAHRQALADRDLARLNLERSEVKASVNGTITNLSLRPGDYITAGTPEVALVDTDSLRIEGYFEETKLARISVGAPVTIRLMGQPATLEGHVESIAAGIEDRERTVGNGLLANINPTFNWVRLAQRVPVRIALDNVPDDARLVAGLTATVVVR